jgi:hypothetical protein
MRSLIVIAAALSLAACATPRERIADSLVGYGLDQARANCVGEQLQRDLSLSQLQELGRVARSYRARDPDPSRLTLDDLLRAASEIRDPAIALSVARAAGRCNLTPLGFAPAKLQMDLPLA